MSSYSREAIESAPTPQVSAPPMREERTVDPYITRSAKPIGQPNINSSVAAEPAKTEETVTLSPQMAALARKEQKFRKEQSAIKEREVALEARAAKLAQLEELQAKLDAGDYSALEGKIDYEKFTQYKIDQSTSTTPEQQALKKLEAELEAVKKAQADDVSKRFDAAVNERRTAVNTLVESKPEFASIKKANAQEAVVQHILDTWEHDNIELSPEEAAKEVAEILKEKAKTWASILEDQAQENVDEKKSLPPLKPAVKTLTNNMAVTGEIKRPVKSFSGMSDSERYAEARRRAEEKLKQGIK